MKEGEEVIYKRRKIYYSLISEFHVCHIWGGLVARNAMFSTLKQAQAYIDEITSHTTLKKEDFVQIAEDIKRVHKSIRSYS